MILQEWILSPDGASPERSVRIEKTSIQYTPRTDHQSTENGSNQERDNHWQFHPDRLPDLALRELDCHGWQGIMRILFCDRTHQREDDENPKNNTGRISKTAVESKQNDISENVK